MHQVVKLGEVVEKATGSRNPTKTPNDSFIYVDVTALDNTEKAIVGARSMLGADAPSRARKLIRSGDVLVSTVRPNLNAVALVPAEFDGQVASTGYCVLRATDKVLPKYLFYFARSRQFVDGLSSLVAGALYPSVTDSQVLEQSLPLPPVSEQRDIVDILSRAEGLVRLRREAEKKAAELIPSLFLDMFGDPATNPKGWPVKSLGELCDRITDGTHQPPKFQESGIPFIFISNIVRGELSLDTVKYISDETYVELTRRCPIEIGDVLYSTVGSYGVPVKVDTQEKFSFQRHIAHIKPQREKLDSDFLVGMLYTPALKAQADSAARGIAQKTVNLGEIRKYQVIAPPLKEQQRFATRVVAARSIQSQQATATATAKATFDALLSKVFS